MVYDLYREHSNYQYYAYHTNHLQLLVHTQLLELNPSVQCDPKELVLKGNLQVLKNQLNKEQVQYDILVYQA